MENYRTKYIAPVSKRISELDAYRISNCGEVVSFPNLSEAKSFIKLPQDLIDIIENREGPIILNDDGLVVVLCWLHKESESKEKFLRFLGENWDQSCGEIRDQKLHSLCWAYVAANLVSAKRRTFVPLCTWHMCALCNPSFLGRDRSAQPDHVCYGDSVENGLLHIQSHGAYKEIQKEFECNDNSCPSNIQIKGEVTGVRNINTLEEALEELKKQPVEADLFVYSALLRLGKDQIYYGPKHSSSWFMGYNAVIMVGLKKMKGEIVVKCKLSNGVGISDGGYIYVSLATLYIPVGVSQAYKTYVRGSVEVEVMYLLSEFVVLEMCEEKEDIEDEEKKDTEENEAKDEAYYQKE